MGNNNDSNVTGDKFDVYANKWPVQHLTKRLSIALIVFIYLMRIHGQEDMEKND
jgi:hypothetical protein